MRELRQPALGLACYRICLEATACFPIGCVTFSASGRPARLRVPVVRVYDRISDCFGEREADVG